MIESVLFEQRKATDRGLVAAYVIKKDRRTTRSQ